MSKELIDRLRIVGGVGDEAADTIERLETERDAAYKIADHYRAKRDELERELAASQKQNVLLRDELFAVLVQDMSRDSAIAKIEALAKTKESK